MTNSFAPKCNSKACEKNCTCILRMSSEYILAALPSKRGRYVTCGARGARSSSLSSHSVSLGTSKINAATYLLWDGVRDRAISIRQWGGSIMKSAPSDSPIWQLKKRELLPPLSYLITQPCVL